MLDIKKVQSTNKVTIIGILSELEIEPKTTPDGREYVQGMAKIKVDQEVNGQMTENVIPVKMFSMKKTKEGKDNAVYQGILKMSEELTSLASAETPAQASVVSITSGQVVDNTYPDKTTGEMRNSFQITTNFIKKANSDDEQRAKFELSGVIGNIADEVDGNGDETGRLVIKFIVIGWKGRADVITLIAENPVAVNHIRSNWEKGDTVSLAGTINMTYKVETWEEEQGFGEPIKRSKTTSKRELLITGGSPCGLDEELSYDNDAIKLALDERTARLNEAKEKQAAKKAVKKSTNDFGF